MRLIDADALLAMYKGDILTAQVDYAEGIRDVIKDIKDAPTVEPKRGKWILSDLQSQADNDNGNYAYVCTNCNHVDIHAKTQKVPYCWWCGAKMKGADDE